MMPQTCPRHAPNMSQTRSRHAPDMPQTCQDYAPDMHSSCPGHAPDNTPDNTPDMPQTMPQLMPQTYLSVLYLIIFFKNIAHAVSFQHCTWLYLALPNCSRLYLALPWYAMIYLSTDCHILSLTGLNTFVYTAIGEGIKKIQFFFGVSPNERDPPVFDEKSSIL